MWPSPSPGGPNESKGSPNGVQRYGEDASGQPADIPEVLLHETVAGWIRTYFKKHPCRLSQDVASNELAMKAIMRDCVSHIRAEYDLAGLCGGFRRRLQDLVDAKGDSLSH